MGSRIPDRWLRPGERRYMKAQDILGVFDDLVADVADALSELTDWGHSGNRPDQYVHDVVADEILPDGRFGVTLDKCHIAESASDKVRGPRDAIPRATPPAAGEEAARA